MAVYTSVPIAALTDSIYKSSSPSSPRGARRNFPFSPLLLLLLFTHFSPPTSSAHMCTRGRIVLALLQVHISRVHIIYIYTYIVGILNRGRKIWWSRHLLLSCQRVNIEAGEGVYSIKHRGGELFDAAAAVGRPGLVKVENRRFYFRRRILI